MKICDPYFRVEVLRRTPNPQQLCWLAMHQCYAENAVVDDLRKTPNEQNAGWLIVKHLLLGNRGHYGILEHPQISLNIIGYPHSTMQQLRTHRVGVSFAVQSGRYTGQRILQVAEGEREPEEVFYLRPPGQYRDRQGKKYDYSPGQRLEDLAHCKAGAERYAQRLREGVSEEQARGVIPFDVRQHFVLSCNARSLMHILDLRAKADAQLEIQDLCQRAFDCFADWMPSLADWYEANRWGKARLSP